MQKCRGSPAQSWQRKAITAVASPRPLMAAAAAPASRRRTVGLAALRCCWSRRASPWSATSWCLYCLAAASAAAGARPRAAAAGGGGVIPVVPHPPRIAPAPGAWPVPVRVQYRQAAAAAPPPPAARRPRRRPWAAVGFPAPA
jgi:hypothetical protein